MNKISHFIVISALAATAFTACKGAKSTASAETSAPQIVGPAFQADSAYAFCAKQCEFGPRTMNSEAHDKCRQWIVDKFRSYGMDVEEQKKAPSSPLSLLENSSTFAHDRSCCFWSAVNEFELSRRSLPCFAIFLTIFLACRECSYCCVLASFISTKASNESTPFPIRSLIFETAPLDFVLESTNFLNIGQNMNAQPINATKFNIAIALFPMNATPLLTAPHIMSHMYLNMLT